MQSLGNMYHDLQVGNYPEPNNYNFLQQVLMSSVEVFNIQNTNMSTVSMAEAKAAAANKSHSEAERRRRKRINGHLATLRALLPNTIKVISLNFPKYKNFTYSINIKMDNINTISQKSHIIYE